MVLNEEEILEGCKLRDNKSQALLYEQHASALFGTALRYSLCGADAQDILQEAFLNIFDNIGQYSGKGSIRAWMVRIVINEALNEYKLRAKNPATDSYDDYEDGIKDSSVIESDSLTHEILLEFIQNLPDGYRMVFNLCEIEGYSSEEVAKMLNCNASTCRSQLVKAKDALRKKVNEFNKKEKIL
jgi:RNA polymerase sigma-70 factor (ECF subfamily)